MTANQFEMSWTHTSQENLAWLSRTWFQEQPRQTNNQVKRVPGPAQVGCATVPRGHVRTRALHKQASLRMSPAAEFKDESTSETFVNLP